MQVFYYNAGTGKDVPAATPINIECEAAIEIFKDITSPESFFGIILPDGQTLQMMFQREGTIYIEQLAAAGHNTLGAVGGREMAEAAIRAAFAGSDPNFELAPYYPKWKPGNVA